MSSDKPTAGNTPIRLMLRLYRQVHEIEQGKLAKHIGINPSSLCRFEKGKTLDEEATLKLINWLFGVRP